MPVEPGRAVQHVDEALRTRVHHVGPILLRSREALHLRAEARRRLGVLEGKLAVWLSAGGDGVYDLLGS